MADEKDKARAVRLGAIRSQLEHAAGPFIGISDGRWLLAEVIRLESAPRRRFCGACDLPLADAREALELKYRGGEHLCWQRDSKCRTAEPKSERSERGQE